MKIKAVDLFCGAGGVTRGLLDAGIDVIAGFDIDSSLKKVYEENNIRVNGEKAKYFNKKVEELTKKDIYKLVGSKTARKKNKEKFLLAGCAPCQPFSLKNKNRHDKTDHRRTLITYFADLVIATKPDFVFMENVAGLPKLEPDNLKYFTDILDEEGFSWETKIVNALHYGVPQNRKRFVLLASKKNEVAIPEGEYDGIAKSHKTVADIIKFLPPIEAGKSHHKIRNHIAAKLSDLNLQRIRATEHSGGRRTEWTDYDLWLKCHLDENGNPKKVHTDVYGRMDWEKPAPTLTTRFNSYTTGAYGHPEQDRAISLKEGALLQTFPENYIFYGTPGQIAKQIGNAVPPKLAEKFGKFFINICN
ncbi:MAG: DNA cytosine methyltransferase [Sulfurimonas sp.]|nr:DNA cytosine methyltransferase [Sulfurimonas sp.]